MLNTAVVFPISVRNLSSITVIVSSRKANNQDEEIFRTSAILGMVFVLRFCPVILYVLHNICSREGVLVSDEFACRDIVNVQYCLLLHFQETHPEIGKKAWMQPYLGLLKHY